MLMISFTLDELCVDTGGLKETLVSIHGTLLSVHAISERREERSRRQHGRMVKALNSD